MKYTDIHDGIFHERLHRFGAYITVCGKKEYVHVRNTGRCREILIPGTKVFLEKSSNPGRKTKYSLIAAYKGEMLINIDSQVPNAVFYEALGGGLVPGFPKMSYLKREAVFGRSRFDIYYETYEGNKGYIEIKGVTLDVDGTAMFPDAPTERGRKHLVELVEAVGRGYEAHVVFLIQYRPARIFRPNIATDPKFAEALSYAREKGVAIHAFDCITVPDGISLGEPVAVDPG